MVGIRESLDLDITQAIRRVDELGARLHKATGSAQVGAGAVPASTASSAAGVARAGSAIGGLGAAFASQQVFDRLTSAIGATVSAASDLNEQITASEVIFGRAAPRIQAFADGAEAIGLARDQALQAANNFGALFQALGLSEDAVNRLGVQLIARAADVTSFRNVAGGVDETLTRFASGVVGEAEAVRRLGVDVSELTVRNKALELGFRQVNGEFTQAEKVQARIALIMEDTALAAGDFVRTSDGLANSQRRLSAEFRNVQIEAGQRFLPVVLAGVNGLSELLEMFTSLPGPIQTTVLAMAGLATAAVGIGLAALAVQRLRIALEGAGVAGRTASVALRGLAVGSAVLGGLAALVGLMQAFSKATKDAAQDVQDLARETDRALAREFRQLVEPRPDSSGFGTPGAKVSGEALVQAGEFDRLEARLRAVAATGEQGLGVVRRLRDEYKRQGEDVRLLDRILREETEAQRRSNQTAQDGQEAVGGLGAAASTAATEMETLDKAIKQVSDQLDATFGRFLDAEAAQLALRDAVFETAEALGRGREEGESYVRFQDRLRALGIDLAEQVRATTEALARSGEISKDAIPQVMRKRLEELIARFPELRTQLQGYIDKLSPESLPREIRQTITLDTSNARRALAGWGVDLRRGALAPRTDAFGFPFNPGSERVTTVDPGLADAERAGRASGAAAAEAALDEIRTTLRRSAAQGMSIGGFLLEGINLGGADAAIREANRQLAETSGRADLVGRAEQMNPSEQLEILRAVEAADRAAKDLAETRAELGANSIEAAIAERELGEAQRKVNETILDSIDASKELNDLLEEETRNRDELTASIRAAEGALRSLSGLQDARKEAQKEGGRLAQFDQRIVEAEAELARVRSLGGAGSLEESRALATLNDLLARRVEQADKTSTANLALVDAQLQLIDAGEGVLAMQGRWTEYFATIASQAGLSADAVGVLIGQLQDAARLAAGARVGAVASAPAPGLVSAGAAGGGGVTIEQLTIVEASSARGTAVELIDELRAVALLGAG